MLCDQPEVCLLLAKDDRQHEGDALANDARQRGMRERVDHGAVEDLDHDLEAEAGREVEVEPRIAVTLAEAAAVRLAHREVVVQTRHVVGPAEGLAVEELGEELLGRQTRAFAVAVLLEPLTAELVHEAGDFLLTDGGDTGFPERFALAHAHQEEREEERVAGERIQSAPEEGVVRERPEPRYDGRLVQRDRHGRTIRKPASRGNVRRSPES